MTTTAQTQRTRKFALVWEKLEKEKYDNLHAAACNKKVYNCYVLSPFAEDSEITLCLYHKNACTYSAVTKRLAKIKLLGHKFYDANEVPDIYIKLQEVEGALHNVLPKELSAKVVNRFRNFCLTIQNYTEEHYQEVLEILNDDKRFRYGIVAKEIGLITFNHHLQMYVECVGKLSYSAVVEIFNHGGTNKSVHVESRRGSAFQASVYCKKFDENFVEIGQMKNPGKRTDLEDAREAWRETGSIGEVLKTCKSYQSYQIIKANAAYNEQQRTWKPNVYWFWGKTGTGKTHTALAECNANDLRTYKHSDSNRKWWNGYDGHGNVIIDEFRASQMSFSRLLTLLDSGACTVELKGFQRQFLAQNIYITCPTSPMHTYTLKDSTRDVKDGQIKQLLRRITEIRYFDKRHESTFDSTKWTLQTAGNAPITVKPPKSDGDEVEHFDESQWLANQCICDTGDCDYCLEQV